MVLLSPSDSGMASDSSFRMLSHKISSLSREKRPSPVITKALMHGSRLPVSRSPSRARDRSRGESGKSTATMGAEASRSGGSSRLFFGDESLRARSRDRPWTGKQVGRTDDARDSYGWQRGRRGFPSIWSRQPGTSESEEYEECEEEEIHSDEEQRERARGRNRPQTQSTAESKHETQRIQTSWPTKIRQYPSVGPGQELRRLKMADDEAQLVSEGHDEQKQQEINPDYTAKHKLRPGAQPHGRYPVYRRDDEQRIVDTTTEVLEGDISHQLDSYCEYGYPEDLTNVSIFGNEKKRKPLPKCTTRIENDDGYRWTLSDSLTELEVQEEDSKSPKAAILTKQNKGKERVTSDNASFPSLKSLSAKRSTRTEDLETLKRLERSEISWAWEDEFKDRVEPPPEEHASPYQPPSCRSSTTRQSSLKPILSRPGSPKRHSENRVTFDHAEIPEQDNESDSDYAFHKESQNQREAMMEQEQRLVTLADELFGAGYGSSQNSLDDFDEPLQSASSAIVPQLTLKLRSNRVPDPDEIVPGTLKSQSESDFIDQDHPATTPQADSNTLHPSVGKEEDGSILVEDLRPHTIPGELRPRRGSLAYDYDPQSLPPLKQNNFAGTIFDSKINSPKKPMQGLKSGRESPKHKQFAMSGPSHPQRVAIPLSPTLSNSSEWLPTSPMPVKETPSSSKDPPRWTSTSTTSTARARLAMLEPLRSATILRAIHSTTDRMREQIVEQEEHIRELQTRYEEQTAMFALFQAAHADMALELQRIAYKRALRNTDHKGMQLAKEKWQAAVAKMKKCVNVIQAMRNTSENKDGLLITECAKVAQYYCGVVDTLDGRHDYAMRRFRGMLNLVDGEMVEAIEAKKALAEGAEKYANSRLLIHWDNHR